jgi:hypothetical protein
VTPCWTVTPCWVGRDGALVAKATVRFLSTRGTVRDGPAVERRGVR